MHQAGQRFKRPLKAKRVVCLDVPDDYVYMQAELVAMLQRKVGPEMLRVR